VQVSKGSIYRRGRVWVINYTVNRRRVRESIGTNRQMAEAVLKKRIVQALEDRHFDKRNIGTVPFSLFAETYMQRCTALLKSVKSERDRVQFWSATLEIEPSARLRRGNFKSGRRGSVRRASLPRSTGSCAGCATCSTAL
jgi:hypothetical protein